LRYTIPNGFIRARSRTFLREEYMHDASVSVVRVFREITSYRINMNAVEISIVLIDSSLFFRDSLHCSVQSWYCTARITYLEMRETRRTLRVIECDHRDRGTARGSNGDFLPAKKGKRKRERRNECERSFPSSSRSVWCGVFPDAVLWRREATGRLIKLSSVAGDVFEQTIESIFLFSFFCL